MFILLNDGLCNLKLIFGYGNEEVWIVMLFGGGCEKGLVKWGFLEFCGVYLLFLVVIEWYGRGFLCKELWREFRGVMMFSLGDRWFFVWLVILKNFVFYFGGNCFLIVLEFFIEVFSVDGDELEGDEVNEFRLIFWRLYRVRW